MESRKEKAIRLFKEGYNCSQAVFAAYNDIYGIDDDIALKLASSFGAGMGRMREVCGAVSSMFMVAGLESGTVDRLDTVGKKHNYDMVQKMTKEFKKINGTIYCKELLGLEEDSNSDTTPAKRTKKYYKKRPCVQLVEDAADIIDKLLADRYDSL